MKYSTRPQQVYAVVLTHYLNDKPAFIFGFITNPRRKTKDRVSALFDHLWERGFVDGLCLRA